MMKCVISMLLALLVLIVSTVSVSANTDTRPNAKAESKPLGRLFFTTKERAVLDRIRAYAKPGDVVAEPDVAVLPTMPDMPDMPVQAPPPQFTLNGYVKRSSGKETTWVNQVPQHETPNMGRLKGHQELSKLPRVVVKLPNGQRLSLNLKVGQTFDTETGKTRDAYERKVKTKKLEPALIESPTPIQ